MRTRTRDSSLCSFLDPLQAGLPRELLGECVARARPSQVLERMLRNIVHFAQAEGRLHAAQRFMGQFQQVSHFLLRRGAEWDRE